MGVKKLCIHFNLRLVFGSGYHKQLMQDMNE